MSPQTELENPRSIVLAIFVCLMFIEIMMCLIYLLIKISHQRKSLANKSDMKIRPPHGYVDESGNCDSNSSDIVHDDCKWWSDKVGSFLISMGMCFFGMLVKLRIPLGWLIVLSMLAFLFFTIGFLLMTFMAAKILKDANPNMQMSHSSQLPAGSDSLPVSNYIVPKRCKWLFEQAAHTMAMGIGLSVIPPYAKIAKATVSAPLLVICGIAKFFMMAIEFCNAKRTDKADMSSHIVPKYYAVPFDVGKIAFGCGVCFLVSGQNMICFSVIVLCSLLLVISGLGTVAWILWISLHDAENPQDAKIAENVASGILPILFASAIARVIETVPASW